MRRPLIGNYRGDAVRISVLPWRPLLIIAFVCLVIGSGCTRNRPTATTPVPTAANATQERATAVSGQTIYVPVYSHIYYHDRQSIINLTVTLSVRNADPGHAIWVDSIHYYDATGRLVRTDLAAPLQLAPLATHEVVIEEDDTSGGSGASFLVKWSNDRQTVAPVVEAVMISAASTQGISFISVGRVIEAFPAGPAAENSAETP